MQTAYALRNGIIEKYELPAPDDYIFGQVCWGEFDIPFTPAFWAVQAWQSTLARKQITYRLGETFKEEVAACMLGGHGLQAEVGLAAFRTLKKNKLFARHGVTEIEFFEHLSAPITLSGKSVSYRFPKQKAKYLAATMSYVEQRQPPLENGYLLRQWLLNAPGIGHKTASWIVRNVLDCDEVAILDVHIVRAGLLAGFFSKSINITKDYLELEAGFIKFAKAIQSTAAKLDAIMWLMMKQLNQLAISRLNASGIAAT